MTDSNPTSMENLEPDCKDPFKTDRGEFHNSLREFAGTPIYMAPEQAGRTTITSAADWYSFVIMLFH